MTTVEQIITESIKDLKLANAQARRKEIYKLIDYYSGTETQKYIQGYFDADAFREIPVKDGYHDHGCDMLRYFLLNRFPIKQQGIKFVDRKKEGNKWHNTLKI